MTIGCLMMDIAGTSLKAEDMEMLKHPLVGGVILFKRNFHNQAQIVELCHNIRMKAAKPMLIAVDQEGGRVQRFHQEFTKLPAMGEFKHLKQTESDVLEALQQVGWLMAAELIASGIDISFAPVLDVDSGVSLVIGDRGFSDEPAQIIHYSSAFIQGMKRAGMLSTGKHFPGHGSTEADSHFELPIDNRCIDEIRNYDLSVFKALCQRGLNAIMPAHVIYPEVDPLPACFSPFWLQTVLRGELKFEGTIFSDDLSMAGAKVLGDMTARAREAFSAGCDMILCCNDRASTIGLLDNISQVKNNESSQRINNMIILQRSNNFQQLIASNDWKNATKILRMFQIKKPTTGN